MLNHIYIKMLICCIVSIALIHSGPSYAQVNFRSLPLDTAVRTGKLANGFTYYIRHNEEPKNRVIMFLANKVGSVLEDDDQQGLAHFMEHMSFNGTKHFPKNELVNYLQKSGVRFGADINAYTNYDETVYQLPLPSDKPDLLRNGLQIMRDWAQEATLDSVEINKERGVVLEEKRLGMGSSERMRRIYYPILMNNSRYASRLPIGLDTVLNHFQTVTLKRFYQDWYRPDLQALIVVGDIDVNSMEKAIKTKFADLKNPIKERPRPIYTVALSGNNEFVEVTDKEMTATVAQILIKHPKQKLRTALDYRNAIIRSLFNQMLADRFEELSRQVDPPFISGGAGISSFTGGLDTYSASVTAKPGELENGFKALWRETERVKKLGFLQSELERAKKSYNSGMDSYLKEKNKIASNSFVQEYLEYFLEETAAPGIEKEYQMVQKDLPAIKLAELNQLAKTYISDKDRDILIMAPEKDKLGLPGQIAVKNWLKLVELENLIPYNDKVNKLSLLTMEPAPGRIVNEQKDIILQTTELTLSNGVRVILKPTKFKNDQVIFSGYSAGGTSLYEDADYQSAANAASIISASGVGNYNPSELGKYLSDKQAIANPYINERLQGISGAATTTDLETALQLIYARFTEPRKDKTVFDGILSRSKSSLANRSSDPKSVFQDTISAVIGQGNIRRTGPSIAKLEQIDLDKAYNIYKERFANASGFTFVFTGSFMVDAIKPLLEKYLGALPSTNNKEQSKDLGIHFPKGKIQKTVYKGSEPQATFTLIFSGEFDYSAAEKLKLEALKEVLEIRLLERLREDESGVYSPNVTQSVGKYPQRRYSFVISFGCAPQNLEKLIASALDEVNELKISGPSQVNIDKFKAEDNLSRETAIKTNSWWLNYLISTLQNQDELHDFKNYEANLTEVSSESLKKIAIKYLSQDSCIRFVLMPEKK